MALFSIVERAVARLAQCKLPIRAILAACLLLLAPPAFAIDPEERLSDPVLEAKAREIAKQLRCVVCDNASIDDSDAQIAKNMRLLVRKRVQQGQSAEAIKQEFVDSYGEYVLLQPRFSFSNLFVWLAAPLAIGFGLLWTRRKLSLTDDKAAAQPASAEPPLSEAERKRLEELTKE